MPRIGWRRVRDGEDEAVVFGGVVAMLGLSASVLVDASGGGELGLSSSWGRVTGEDVGCGL